MAQRLVDAFEGRPSQPTEIARDPCTEDRPGRRTAPAEDDVRISITA